MCQFSYVNGLLIYDSYETLRTRSYETFWSLFVNFVIVNKKIMLQAFSLPIYSLYALQSFNSSYSLKVLHRLIVFISLAAILNINL